MPEHASCALLGQLLVAYGVVSTDQLEAALRRQEATGEPLGEILVQMGLAEPEQIERALRAQARLRGRRGQKGTFVLVVDDDPEVGALVAEILDGAGHRVGVAENIAEARAALMAPAGLRPRLIVLDIGLPGPNGIEFLADLRSHPALRLVPVIVLTGHPGFEAEIRSRGLAISAFLRKPCAPRELLAAVSEALAASPLPTGPLADLASA